MQNQSNNKIYDQINDKVKSLESVGADEILNNTLDKLIKIQVSKYEKYISDINVELTVFEEKYKMKSSEFYAKFLKGEMGDDMDFIEWSGLYENFEYYNKQSYKLKMAV